MKLLLVTDWMNGYSKSIKQTLSKKIDTVDVFYESKKIKTKDLSLYEKLLRSLLFDFKVKSIRSYYDEIEKNFFSKKIEQLKDNYDIILDIRAQSNINFLEVLREKYKTSKMILFIWDDLKYQNYTLNQFKYFDDIFSYNEDDCEKFSLKYRPSFFCEEFLSDKKEKYLESFYIGNVRDKKRIDVILALNKKIEGNKKNVFYLDRKWKNFYRIYRYKEIKKISINEHMSFEEIVKNSLNSKALIDVNYKNQKGLGLRPMEAIGAECKLITTNKNIISYDFYNENNIYILKDDLSNINGITEFLKKPFIKYSKEITHKYSLIGWIEEILDLS